MEWKLNKVRKYYSIPWRLKRKGDNSRINLSRFYIYNYYKVGREYSNSIGSRVEVYRGEATPELNRQRKNMPIIIEIKETE